MNYNSNDNIVLVAPRPVRLASSFSSRAGAAAFRVLSTTPSEHLKLVDDSHDSNPQSDTISPRASPRYVLSGHPSSCLLLTASRASLQSEALEEFLSILRLYPPTSPVLRATVRRNGTMSVVPYERPHPYKRDTSENGKSSHTPSPSRSRAGVCVTPFKSWSPEGNLEIGDEPSVWYPFEWRSYDVLSTYLISWLATQSPDYVQIRLSTARTPATPSTVRPHMTQTPLRVRSSTT